MSAVEAAGNPERRYNRRAVRFDLVPAPMQVAPAAIGMCREQVESRRKSRLRALVLCLVRQMSGAREIGEGFHWARGIRIGGARIGRYVSIGADTDVSGPVSIGDLTMLSGGVKLVGNDHDAGNSRLPLRVAFPAAPRAVTVIEADCWVGHSATLLEGVRLGRGTVVGAGAVVTRDTEPYSIVAGVPARPLRRRFAEAEMQAYDALLYGSPPAGARGEGWTAGGTGT